MQGLTERYTSFQGRPLRYLVGGSGPPMLLCHGFIGSAENFQEWFAELLPRRTVVAPDLPGFGRSVQLARTHDAVSLALAAARAAEDAGLDEYDVAGLCLGACVALAVQRLRPGKVRRLLLHTPLLAPWLTRRRFHLQSRVMLAPGIFPGMVWLSHRRVVSDLYKRLMIEGPDVDRVAAQVNFDNQRRANPRAIREWLRDGLRRDDIAQVAEADQPALIIVAADDRIADVSRLRRALLGLPHVRLAVIDGGGHAWTPTMLAQQRAIIAAFLDDRALPAA